MTLRDIIAGAAALFVVLALGMAIISPTHSPLLLVALVVAAGTLLERRRYRAGGGRPTDGRWRPTGERFADPESGRPTTVWVHDASGERRYVADE